MPLSVKLFVRDLLSGSSLLFLVCLITAVASLSTVSLFTDRVRQAITQQAGESLAADIRIESDLPIQAELRDIVLGSSLISADIINFRSVVMQGFQSSLADIRGVSAGYPLRGTVYIADSPTLEGYPIDAIPDPGTIWVEPSILARLNLAVGDSIDIGAKRFVISKVITFRPDEGWRFLEIAPTILLNIEDIEGTQLVVPGSRVEYEYLIAGSEAELNRQRNIIDSQLLPGQELDDINDARPEVRNSVIRAEQFLHLAAVISVILSGIAIAMCAKEFVGRHEMTVAIYKTFGANHGTVYRLLGVHLIIIILIATFIGLAFGYIAQLYLAQLGINLIEAELPQPSLSSVFIAPLTSVLVIFGFALIPIASLRNVSPIKLLRNDVVIEPLSRFITIGTVVIFLALLIGILVNDIELLITILLIGFFATVVMFIFARILIRLSYFFKGYLKSFWKYGISNIARRKTESATQVIAFGLSIMVILILTISKDQLLMTWQNTLPESTPNNFLINIQPNNEDDLVEMLQAYEVEDAVLFPIVRGRISHVNDIEIDSFEAINDEAADELRDDINLTWSSEVPEGNTIISGDWWETSSEQPELSLAESYAEETGLSLGDEITFFISGQYISATVTNIRSVNWESFNPNFFLIISPGLIENFPYTSITSFYLEEGARELVFDITSSFPSISAIDIGAVIRQVQGAMSQASIAVQYVFLFTLIAGILVMIATIQVSKKQRIYEGGIIKSVGGTAGIVQGTMIVEFFCIGGLSGLLGSSLAIAGSFYLATSIFELESYSINWFLLPIGFGIGGLFVSLISFITTKSISHRSLTYLLREV